MAKAHRKPSIPTKGPVDYAKQRQPPPVVTVEVGTPTPPHPVTKKNSKLIFMPPTEAP